MVSFFLILECLNEIWAKFDFFAPTVLYIIDKVGNVCWWRELLLRLLSFLRQFRPHTTWSADVWSISLWTGSRLVLERASQVKHSLQDQNFRALRPWGDNWPCSQCRLSSDNSKLINFVGSRIKIFCFGIFWNFFLLNFWPNFFSS